MYNRCYKIISCGPIRLESFGNMNSYPVRNLRMKEFGSFAFNQFYGEVSESDALLNLHEGDLVSADVRFFTYKKRGKWVQRVRFSDLIKLKEVI